MAGQILTADRLRELLHYDPTTGIFKWKVQKGKIRSGDTAGNLRENGYVGIRIDYKLYKAHRLAWLYVFGEWPPSLIDHINTIRNDNRILNIRLATAAQNSQNRLKANSDSSSGLLGVVPDRGRWNARIKVNGSDMHIGCFDTPELAHAAYINAKAKHHPFQTFVIAQDAS